MDWGNDMDLSPELLQAIKELVIIVGVGGVALGGAIYLGGKVLDVIKAYFEAKKR